MGLSALGALIAIGLAYIGQSPTLLRQLGLKGVRLDLRVRAYTGYGLALLLLAIGFFLAGVPLQSPAGLAAANSPEDTTELAAALPTAETSPTIQSTRVTSPTLTPAATTTRQPTPLTGAFGRPTDTPESEPTETARPTRQPTATPTIEPTETPTPTPTMTPTPTETPTPTLTPTPIEGRTATIRVASSTIWIRRTPGGSLFAQVDNGATVVVLEGHANQGGQLWQEVSTLDGQVGWILLEYLEPDEE